MFTIPFPSFLSLSSSFSYLSPSFSSFLPSNDTVLEFMLNSLPDTGMIVFVLKE